MRNDWIDVIIINLCLLAYAHWLSDVGKDHTKLWTLVPELVGTTAALVSLQCFAARDAQIKHHSDNNPLNRPVSTSSTVSMERFTGACLLNLVFVLAGIANSDAVL
tara:strand:- start:156 stop:473 length:318 start_codon:yes stop_codon:yes gene_type:complete